MWKKLSVLALAVAACGFVPNAKAGEEMVVPEETPAPRYNYSQRHEEVYYPRPVIAVYPSFGFGFSAWPYGVYGYHRPYYSHHRYYGHRYYGGGHRGYARHGYGRGYHRR